MPPRLASPRSLLSFTLALCVASLARAAAQLQILGAPQGEVDLGGLVALTAGCATAVPTSSPLALLVLLGVLASFGALALRSRRAALGIAAVAFGASFLSPPPADGVSCGGTVSWEAQSESELFAGSGDDFSFTPTMRGTFVVTATAGIQTASVSIPVCPAGQSMDACGVCGGNGGGCLCVESLAVGYPGTGDTCSFSLFPSTPDLPAIAMDEFHYNEMFSGGGYETPFGLSGGAFNDLVPGVSNGGLGTLGQSRGCGACVEISGENGTIVGMVNEIADVASVGESGLPVGVNIEFSYIDLVRNGSGAAVDVAIRPVACPHTENIQIAQRVFNETLALYWSAEEFTPAYHRYPIQSIEIKSDAGHTEWYPLPPKWTNKFLMYNYADNIYIPVPNPPNTPVRFRFTSIYGDVVVSDPIQLVDRPLAPGDHTHVYDTGVNFDVRPAPALACTPASADHLCGNRALDAGEDCETALQMSVSCGSLGAGSGTAYCDPDTCLWDTGTCGP